MQQIDKIFWAFGILVLGIFLIKLRSNAKNYINNNPEIKNRANKMYWNIFIYLCIPIIILGIKKLTGETKFPNNYIKLKQFDFYTILLDLSWIVIYIKGTHWIFIRKGAEFLSLHHELFIKPYFIANRKFSIQIIKTVWIILIMFGVFSLFI